MAKSLFYAWLVSLTLVGILALFHPVGVISGFALTTVWLGRDPWLDASSDELAAGTVSRTQLIVGGIGTIALILDALGLIMGLPVAVAASVCYIEWRRREDIEQIARELAGR